MRKKKEIYCKLRNGGASFDDDDKDIPSELFDIIAKYLPTDNESDLSELSDFIEIVDKTFVKNILIIVLIEDALKIQLKTTKPNEKLLEICRNNLDDPSH